MADQRRSRRDSQDRDQEFEQKIIDLARVTRVMAGGKRMRFRACVVIGDRKGRLGYGIAKGADVALAVNKAVTKAKKAIMVIPISEGTVTNTVKVKFKAAQLLIKPAPQGTGVMAGGAVRAALEISGVDNIVAKMFGSKNKINNIKALFAALEMLSLPAIKSRTPKQVVTKVPVVAEAVAPAVVEASEAAPIT